MNSHIQREVMKIEIIERINSIMSEKNIKASELAKQLNVNQSVISTWKSKLRNPPSEYIIKICELLKVEPYYLLTGEKLQSISESEIEELYNKLNDEYKIIAKYKIKELIKEQQQEMNEQKFRDLG